MNPVFGVILSALILGEHEGFGAKYVAALVCISIGIALVNGNRRGRRPQPGSPGKC